MRAVQNDRFCNPNRDVQIFEEIRDPARRLYCSEEWELPGGARAQLIKGDAAILLPRDIASQAMRMFFPNRIDPEAPEAGNGRLFQFLAMLSFDPKQFEGY